MPSARSRLRLRAALVAATALALIALAPFAFAQERMRAVVRLAPSDDELWSRVRGQTVDLDVDLDVVRGDGLERTTRSQLARARELARDRGARVVVWFVHDRGGGITVNIAEPGAGRLFLRQLGAPSESRVGRSALTEEAAVVVRSALRALAAGGKIGVEVEPSAVEPATDRELPPPRRTPAAPRRSLAVHAGAGWQVVGDGVTPLGFQGISARLGIARGRLGASIGAMASLPATIEDELTSVEISRHAIWASANLDLWRGDRASLAAELGVGAVGFYRSTVALDPGVDATPNHLTAAALVSPGLRLRWRPTTVTGAYLELVAAADGVLGAPELGYEVNGSFERRDRMWPVQPRFGLAITVEFQGSSRD